MLSEKNSQFNVRLTKNFSQNEKKKKKNRENQFFFMISQNNFG